jgi:hypothetical protein
MIAAAKSPPQPAPPPVDTRQLLIPEISPFIRDSHARAKRTEAALSMADDETYAYVLVLLRKDDGAARPEITVSTSVADESWWPPIVETLRRVGRAALTR